MIGSIRIPMGIRWKVLLISIPMLFTECKRDGVPTDYGDNLSALALQAETVYFAHRTIVQSPEDGPFGVLKWPATFLLRALQAVGLEKPLKGNIEYLLLGAKKFRAPKNLGPIRWDGCYIVEPSLPEPLMLASFFQDPPITQIASKPVWSWQYQVEEDVWSFFITQIRGRNLFIATDLALLRSVVKHLEAGDVKGELRERRPEWQLVDRRNAVWLVRRYRHDQAREGSVDDDREVDTKTIAMTFSFDHKSNLVSLRSITAGANAGGLGLLQSETNISVLQVSPGVWETAFKLEASESGMRRLLIAFGLLGFGWYL